MECDVERGINFAMIPVAAVGLANIIAILIFGFIMLIAIHSVALGSMFPEQSSYRITNYYGNVETMNTTPQATAYPLVLCIFLDSMIVMGICGAFKVDVPHALLILLCIFTAPISIPILWVVYSGEKSSAQTENSVIAVSSATTYVEQPSYEEPAKPSNSLNPAHRKFEKIESFEKKKTDRLI